MNATLYRLTADFLPVMNDLESRDDLPEQVIRDTLEVAAGELTAKLVNVVGYACTLAAEAAMVKAREDELSARRKRLESRAAWLRDYALQAMRTAKIDRVDSPDFTARPRQNPGAVAILDEQLLPPEFVRTRTVTEPDRQLIRDRLVSGAEVPGAALRVTWRLDIR